MYTTRHVIIIITGLIIYIIIHLYINHYKSIEQYQQMYNSHTVQLKKEVTNPLTIAVGETYTYMAKLMKIYSNKFPMIIYNNNGSSYNSINELNRGVCDFAVTTLDLVEELYVGNEPFTSNNKNLRIVSGLNNTSIILMARNNFTITQLINTNNLYLTLGDLQKYISITNNKLTICIDISDNATYYIIMKILHLYKFDLNKINIITGNVFENKSINQITDDFQSGNIDIIAASIVHPDDRIYEFYQHIPCRFIGIEDVNIEIIHVKSPNYIKELINLADYDVTTNQTRMLEVFSCPLCIVTTKDMDSDSVYRYVNGLFENIEYLHENYKKNEITHDTKHVEVLDGFLTEQDYYKIGRVNISSHQIDSLSPSSFYNIKSMVPIHEGTRKFLIDIGLITYNNSEFCKNYLPDGDPRKMQSFFVNCNSNPELEDGRHYGQGIY